MMQVDAAIDTPVQVVRTAIAVDGLRRLANRAEMDLYVNGARRVGFAHNLGAAGGCHTLRLAAQDVVDVRIHQSTGASMSIPADGSWHG